MNTLIWLINKTIYPLYSFLINSLYWLFHLSDLKSAKKEKEYCKKTITDIKDIENFLSKFTWTKDNYIDWTPWIITIFDRHLKDDCDGAATLGKWLYKCIGIESNMAVLYKDIPGTAHMVCIRKDKTEMISNSHIITLNPSNWQQSIYDYFDNVYIKIVLL